MYKVSKLNMRKARQHSLLRNRPRTIATAIQIETGNWALSVSAYLYVIIL